jgi:hypothetical protein
MKLTAGSDWHCWHMTFYWMTEMPQEMSEDPVPNQINITSLITLLYISYTKKYLKRTFVYFIAAFFANLHTSSSFVFIHILYEYGSMEN